jgi:TP901 family phage tail tape measure protein
MGTIANMNVKLSLDASDFERGIAKAQGSAESMVAKLKAAGTAMSLGVTAPLLGIATMAIKSAGDFEQSMNIMGQVSGATADQMATLQAQALEMGAATSFSAGEAAEAQLELAKAGLEVDEIMSALPGVLDMAAAGGMSLSESAEVAANALNAFNLPASEMGTVANMLAAAANASSVDIHDLAMSSKMAGAVFAANKQPMDDMVTALAMLGNAGLKGSDAGTSLKTMMMSLAAPTDAAYQTLQDMNIAVYDAAGNMRGFSDIVNDLANSTATMSDEQRNVALSTIFGSDAIRAASILTRDYGKSWDALSDALGDGSAASKVAGARMKGIGGAIEYLRGSLDSFLIGAALPYLNMLGDWIRVGADAITAFGSMPQPIMDAAIAFAAVLAAAGPLMLVVSGLGAVFAFLASPIFLAIAAVGALGVAWATNFGGIQDKAKSTIKALEPVFAELQRWIDLAMKGDFSGLQAEIGNALNSVKVAVSEFKWSDYITPLTDWAVYIAQLAWDTVVTTLTDWGTWISSLDWGGFITTLTDWGEYIQGTVLNWADYISKLDWGGYIDTVLDWGTYITTTITDWGTYVIGLDWGTYIKPLTDWGTYITATLTDWGTYITELDWGLLVTAWSDWSSKIRELGWSVFVTSVDWATYIGSVVWDNYLTKIDWAGIVTTVLDWGTYIKAIVWDDYITVLWATYITPIDWGKYIPVIDWAKVGLTVLDWAMWIPALAWEVIIMPIHWGAWIVSLVWNTIVNPVKWNEFITGLTDWNNWVKLLEWSVFLSPIAWGLYIASIDWGKYIPVKFAWNSFVTKVKWLEHIAPFTWPPFDAPDWPDFIDDLKWPVFGAPTWTDFIDDLKWPDIKAPSWEDFIDSLSWPEIPSFPGWAELLAALGWGGGAPAPEGQATGGPVTAGVPYIVGERGQELFVPNVSGTIIPNHELGAYAGEAMGSAGGGAAVQIGTVNVLNELDIRELAYQVAGYMQRRR